MTTHVFLVALVLLYVVNSVSLGLACATQRPKLYFSPVLERHKLARVGFKGGTCKARLNILLYAKKLKIARVGSSEATRESANKNAFLCQIRNSINDSEIYTC